MAAEASVGSDLQIALGSVGPVINNDVRKMIIVKL